VLAAGVLTVFAFDFILRSLRAYFVDVAGKSADIQLASRLFEQLLGMRMANRPPSAGAQANTMREFEHLREFFTSATLVALVDLPFVFLFVGIIYVIGGPVAVVPLVAIPAVVIVGLIMQVPLRMVARRSLREAQQKHAILVESIMGIETVKSACAEGRMQREWENFVGATATTGKRAHTLAALALNFSVVMTQLVTVGVVVFGVFLIQDGLMTVGALVACTILAGRAMAPLGQIAGLLTRYHQAMASLRALDGMMKQEVDRPTSKRFLHRPTFNGNVEFKNVTFRYPGQKQPALNEVSIKINAGERVAIIGRIGSGKTTLERLMMGLYDPEEGAVLVDGTDIRQIDPVDLRRNIGCVPQDNFLFFGSVRENIALGAPFVDDEMVMRAARAAGADDFVQRHPDGYDMPVGERGSALSGGQRQAVAVARALLFDPPILVLDEPTSNMDHSTENRFVASLREILPGRTLLLITHRGSLLTLVDRLVVLDYGRVVADGPKDSVLQALMRGKIQSART
jgi:ATP-binding cassette subfamily C protein LapB